MRSSRLDSTQEKEHKGPSALLSTAPHTYMYWSVRTSVGRSVRRFHFSIGPTLATIQFSHSQVRPSVWLSVHMPVCLSFYLSVCLSFCLSAWMSFCWLVHSNVYRPSLRLSNSPICCPFFLINRICILPCIECRMSVTFAHPLHRNGWLIGKTLCQ